MAGFTLFPTVGMAEGDEIVANFGAGPFRYDFRSRLAQERKTIVDTHRSEQGSSVTVMKKKKDEQGSTTQPSMTYTRTGQISKAKKSVRAAHTCACGRVSPRETSILLYLTLTQTYSNAKHLRYLLFFFLKVLPCCLLTPARRLHQVKHKLVLYCKYSNCNTAFHTQDLLSWHEEAHALGYGAWHVQGKKSPSFRLEEQLQYRTADRGSVTNLDAVFYDRVLPPIYSPQPKWHC